jgi:hypothetical protein
MKEAIDGHHHTSVAGPVHTDVRRDDEQYDETMRRLEKSGDWMPDGLEYHVAFRSGKRLASQRNLGLARAVRRIR